MRRPAARAALAARKARRVRNDLLHTIKKYHHCLVLAGGSVTPTASKLAPAAGGSILLPRRDAAFYYPHQHEAFVHPLP